LANALCYSGRIYEFQGDYVKSLEYQFAALKLREEINDRSGISYSIHYVGDIYQSQGELSDKLSAKMDYNNKALDQFFKSLKIAEEIGDKASIANTYNCIGNSYREQGDDVKAFDFYFKAIKLREETKDKQGFAITYNNMGKLYLKQGKYTEALDHLFKSLTLAEEVGDKRAVVKAIGSIGNCYLKLASVAGESAENKQKNYSKALEYCSKSLLLGKEANYLEYIANSNHALGEIYASPDFKGRNADKALEYYKKYISERDSINSTKLGQAEMNFEFEKKESELKLKAEAEKAISTEEKKKQQVIIFAVAGVLLIVMVFSTLLYKRFRLTNKQKQIIEIKSKETEEQKLLIEEKQKEVLDSIRYASRIQRALITSENYISKHLNRLIKK
ncbi:MAG: tetratricopeptide repeat protein, partial [Bacteroidia bacterium]|nr:tetratricopeptide repeat protein [Bacteroidia bacterium]